MTTVVNHALRQLRAGKLAIGIGLRQARTVDTAQIAATCGFDWLFIDCEHNSMDPDTAAQIAAASLAVGVTPMYLPSTKAIAPSGSVTTSIEPRPILATSSWAACHTGSTWAYFSTSHW